MRKFLSNLTQHTPFLIFITIIFFYIFYPFHYEEGGISADAVFDAQIARNILLGDGLGWQATLQPPFHAILTSAVYPLTGSILIGGILISKLMWWLLPIPVYILAKEMFGTKIGLTSAILAFFHPHFSFSSGMMEPTVTYPTLLLFGICFMWHAFSKEKIFYAFLGGLFFTFSYLSRSEGLFIFLISLSVLLFIAFKDYFKTGAVHKRLLIIAVLIISFILSSLPYILFLKDTYGKVVLSPKSTYVQTWMKWRIYHDNDLGETGNPDLWGLSKNGKLMWQKPKGIGDLVRYLMSQPEKSLRVYLLNFSMQIPGRIPNNSGQWLYPQVYPWYFVIPAFFWIASRRRKEDWEKTIFLLSPFLILFILPIFSEGWWKYLLPYSPFLIILGVAGVSDICERFRWKQLLPAFTVIIAIYSLWTVKASPLVKHGDKGVIARGSMLNEQIKAGKWAQKRFKGIQNYMVQWSKLTYYLNGRWIAKPVTTYDGMIWYARKNRVDYIVIETSGRDESEEIIRIMGNTADLEVADVYESTTSSYSVVFLRLRK
ncbi:MAG: glycosyltransferase family 39 protein [Deltaproteobacteria bacterium]|nr:glycosyltransferase family 39 protein [Deltaproteobacteria bacterium]